MQIIKSVAEMIKWSFEYRCNNPDKKIGFVPTMGYLHQGHLSLIELAAQKCNAIVVSIFVNPIQFNNAEDLEHYPRDLPRDISLLEKLNDPIKISVVFIPDATEVYKTGYPEIFLDYPKLTGKLCGKSRPGHFSGVLAIVHNLFMFVQPHIAVFGLKDYQQYLLIKKMSTDLQMGVEVIPGNLIRDPDGMAMSSRNARLSPSERETALIISKSLFKVRDEFQSGKLHPEKRKSLYLKNILHESLSGIQIDYASLYDCQTLEEYDENITVENTIVAVAVFIGKIRLIDNLLLISKPLSEAGI